MVSLINMMVGYYQTSDDDDMVRCYLMMMMMMMMTMMMMMMMMMVRCNLKVNIWTPFSAHASACRDDKNDEKQLKNNAKCDAKQVISLNNLQEREWGRSTWVHQNIKQVFRIPFSLDICFICM